MTDILLDNLYDLDTSDGQIYLIDSVEKLTLQRLNNKLRAFTNTLWTNINYGIDVSLVFKRGTKELLDGNIQRLISETKGITEIISFQSEVGVDRKYVLNFECRIETGEILGIKGITFGRSAADYGVWFNGKFMFNGTWFATEIWGSN